MIRHPERRSVHDDPARLAREQVRAGLPVTVCPFCGGKPSGSYLTEDKECCCMACFGEQRGVRHFGPCPECPHRQRKEDA